MAVKFETEEEAKEYVDNLGTEYRFSCFKEKNPEGCHLLADYLEAIKRDFDGAAKIYKMNCDDYKHSKSCYKFGSYNFLGKGCKADVEASFGYFKKACDLGYMNSCLHAGVMLVSSDKDPKTNKPFIEQDFVAGVKYMEKACAQKHPLACYYASGIYITGAEGVPQDKTRASQLSEAACEGGNFFACMNLSKMYKRGDGVEKNEKKAASFLKRAKDLREEMTKKAPIGLQQHT